MKRFYFLLSAFAANVIKPFPKAKIIAVIAFTLLINSTAFAQSTVTGTVRDEKGITMPGVSVKVKGSQVGAVTDESGRYTIRTTSPGAVLVFAYIGFASKEVAVAGKTTINVSLADDAQGLNDVVVIGYGTQKKVNLTGAVAQVDGKQLQDRPVPNAIAALQGISPGVTITRGSGKPGAEGLGIRIRGFSSANTTAALTLVDGVEMDLALINPDDIENISVLKDAAAASIYGARAAGGVILVTTKKGASGKTRINFSNNYSLNITARQPQRLNSWDEQTLIDEARLNATGAREFTPEQIEWLKNPNFNYRENQTADRWDYYDNTNWIKEGMDKVNASQKYNLSIGGGKQELNYLLSGSYFKRDGVMRFGPDDNSVKTMRLSVNSEINKYLSVGAILSYAGSQVNENSYSTGNIIDLLYRVRTRQSLYVPKEDVTGNIYNGDLQLNPVDIEKNAGFQRSDFDNFVGKINITAKNFVKGLTVDLNASRNYGFYNYESNKRTLNWYGRSTNTVRNTLNALNQLDLTKNKSYQDNLTGQISYDLQLNKHSFKVLGGASFEQYRKDEFSASATGMVTNDFFSLNFGDAATKTNKDKVETWAFGSVFGRFNYNYDEKYLFEAVVRYDGSSRLAPENRFQVFPAFSAGWRISEEQFFKDNVPFVSNLKLRGSWGQVGNGAVLGFYDYFPLITSGIGIDNQNRVIFNGLKTQYLYQNQLASANKTWETVQSSNIGIDAGLFKNKLTLTADYYVKYNKDMLADLFLPSTIGVNVPKLNVGELKSWGWELELKWRDTFKNGDYRIGFNVADNQNEVTKYDGRNSVANAGVVEILQGYPLNTVWGYKTDGYFQTQAEADAYKARVRYPFFANPAAGDVKYLDLDGNGVIDAGGGTPTNSGDLVNLGTTNARYTFGLDLGASWKGFDITVFFQGVAKRAFLIDENTLSPILGTANMPWSIHLDRWSPENPNAFFPRMFQTSAHNFRPSDKWVQNGNYIRLKNLTLGYNFKPQNKIFQNLRVYVAGQDLFEKTDVLSVFDPEVGNDVSAQAYPFYRSVSFGLNITL
ncbi:SusC/RagA family TonB-linked outer membrane protein [Pedobacter sp. Leaf41]|uniref:SusC/RagA family TonB-linked outer membrane protein n=1 Tax=Pedobacter sp. Leaf41 TaxID=1736218 RepID=UPI000702E617|nr:TonB-dependent receptor [Pedobacter sp. Leaf41]KQN38577.1 SusC/RagA family TonB-linked outer membrane protein [Pedobacter sp. Leaf41]